MNKFIIIFIFFISFFGFSQTNAIKIVMKNETINFQENETITRGKIFDYFANKFGSDISKSYKYIKLNYKDIDNNSDVSKSLKKLVYLDLIDNFDGNIYPNKQLNAYNFYSLSEKIYGEEFIKYFNIEKLKNRLTTSKDIDNLEAIIKKSKSIIKYDTKEDNVKRKSIIMEDVYKTLINNHYDNKSFNKIDILDGAIKGMANSTKDKYTKYFPPVDNKSFKESLTGEYEGIGAYVEMTKAGEFKIISPLYGSPAHEAGLKGGDIITHVDGKEILPTNSLKEVVSWVKGKAGTIVILTVKRANKVFDLEVLRAKITIKDLEYKLIDNYTFYIQLKFFGSNIYNDFKDSIIELKKHTKVKKVIIDLRNNPGGYLDKVAKILSYFVEKDQKTVVVKYQNTEKTFESAGYDLIDFGKYKIVILQNSGSASASEIMIGTIKDYYPKATIIGEKSYGKGSVQTIKSYSDGSSLKFTIAKWFTGLTETGIDGIGIKPDIEIIQDNKLNNKKDMQLEKAKKLR